MRRHPLLDEAKTELDVAYDAVKRAELAIMTLEQEYNERARELDGEALAVLTEEKQTKQARIDVDDLYAMQSRAVSRFSAVSSAFAITAAIDQTSVAVDLLRVILFPDAMGSSERAAAGRELRAFSNEARQFLKKRDAKTEQAVRAAWDAIEARLEPTWVHPPMIEDIDALDGEGAAA